MDPVAQAGGRLLRGAQNLAELGEPGLALVGRAARPCGWRRSCALQLVDAAAELFERLDLDSIRCVRRPEFLDQPHGPQAATAQAAPGVAALGHAGSDLLEWPAGSRAGCASSRISSVRRLCGKRPRICSFSSRSVTETCTVRSKGNSPVIDPPQHLDGVLNDVVAFQQLAAEPGPRDLDLLGQGDFLLPREQRDLAHLRQIHAHRVVRPRLADRRLPPAGGLPASVPASSSASSSHATSSGTSSSVVHGFVGKLHGFVRAGRAVILQIVQQCVVQCNNSYNVRLGGGCSGQ